MSFRNFNYEIRVEAEGQDTSRIFLGLFWVHAHNFPHVRGGANGEKWGKMGKNGERILWGKHFRIGNFPHFSPLKKTSKDVQFSLKWLR